MNEVFHMYFHDKIKKKIFEEEELLAAIERESCTWA